MLNIRNVLIAIVGSAAIAWGLVSCGGGGGGGGSTAPATTATVVRSTTLTGAQQNPPVVTAATGRGAVVVNPTTMEITGGITFSGLTPLPGMYHIHQAPSGNPTGNGPVIIGLILANDGVTAVVPPNTMLTQAQYNALLAGELYYNVHTVANPDGEIRGQITGTSGVIAGVASISGGQEVPASTSTATGKGTVVVDQANPNTILIAYITHNVANATMAHIHTSPSGPGSNGVIIVNFNTLQTNFDGAGTNLVYPPAGSQMTAQNVTDFLANYLYFNVHSSNNLCAPAPDCGAGEIRGNITAIQ